MKLNFCPECAAPLTKHDDTQYVCANKHIYWNNPRLSTATVLLKDGKILVSKRALEPAKGKYDLPGGFACYNENVFATVEREIAEETGLKVTDLEIVATYMTEPLENVSVCDMVVLANHWEGEPVANDDSAALEWKPVEFINSPDFAWSYPGLVEKLQSLIDSKQ